MTLVVDQWNRLLHFDLEKNESSKTIGMVAVQVKTWSLETSCQTQCVCTSDGQANKEYHELECLKSANYIVWFLAQSLRGFKSQIKLWSFMQVFVRHDIYFSWPVTRTWQRLLLEWPYTPWRFFSHYYNDPNLQHNTSHMLHRMCAIISVYVEYFPAFRTRFLIPRYWQQVRVAAL